MFLLGNYCNPDELVVINMERNIIISMYYCELEGGPENTWPDCNEPRSQTSSLARPQTSKV